MTKDQKIKELKSELRRRNRFIKDLQRAIGVGNDYTDHIQRTVMKLLDTKVITVQQYSEIFQTSGEPLCPR